MPRSSRRTTYLVEHYRPGLDAAGLGRCVTALRADLADVEADARAVRFVCSVSIPDDEAFLVLLEADSTSDVSAAYMWAGATCDRITAVTIYPTRSCLPTGDGRRRPPEPGTDSTTRTHPGSSEPERNDP